MNSSRFPHPHHFSLTDIIKLSNIESVIDFLTIPSTIELSSSSILFATLVFIPLYAIISLHARVIASRRTPSTICKECVSRRGVGQKGEVAVTVPASLGSVQKKEELRVAKEANFPDDWWTSEGLFQAEKRAIFSKSWLYATHSSRFQKPGDYLSFELASFPFFLILGKDRRLRAFHNVCRHRAYPVIRKEKGSSTIVGCRYHGWTYNATGALIKAPQFENVEGFDTSRNGLFEISLHVTDSGLVFINFDASIDGPAVRFQDWYNGGVKVDVEMLGLAKKGGYVWSQSWAMDGNFNWKAAILLEGFHRIWSPSFVHMHDLRMTFRTTVLDDSGNNAPGSLLQQTETEASSLFNLMRLLSRCMQSTMPSAPTFKRINISPVTVLAVQNNCIWYSVRVVPLSAGRTTLVYDVYCKAGGISSKEIVALRERSRNAIQGFEARWKSGDKSGFRQFEERLSGGLRNMENEHQTHILSLLQSHLKLEKAAGGEIYPAFAGAQFMGAEGIEAELICKELDRCSTAGGSDNALAW